MVAVALLASGGARAESTVSPGSKSTPSAIESFAAFIAEASLRFGVPRDWIRSVMRVESADNARALSPKGAMGLMQIMPATWAALRTRYGLGSDPLDPHDNILAGAAYLRELYNRYGARGFLAAYNAGPGRYEDHLATGRALPDETRAYVAMLAPIVGGEQIDTAGVVQPAPRSWTQAPLFITRAIAGSIVVGALSDQQRLRGSDGGEIADQTALASPPTDLFVRTSGGDGRP
jgi:hypothetical protein